MDAQTTVDSRNVAATEWLDNEPETLLSSSQQHDRERYVEWLLGLGIVAVLISAGVYFLAVSPYLIRVIGQFLT
jgi:hypothetical protein